MINLSKEIQSRSNLTNYSLNDLNQATKQAIQNIERGENVTVCKDKDDLYNQLCI